MNREVLFHDLEGANPSNCFNDDSLFPKQKERFLSSFFPFLVSEITSYHRIAWKPLMMFQCHLNDIKGACAKAKPGDAMG